MSSVSTKQRVAKHFGTPGVSSQDKRRQIALKRQKEKRSDYFAKARDLIEDRDGDEETGKKGGKGSKDRSRADRVRDRRRYWASQVCCIVLFLFLS
jgi:hypothetical protein